jgi:hypothetical protein
VSDTAAAPTKSAAWSQRVRELPTAYPEAVAIATYALVAMAALVAAYFALFYQFANYDDEGTVLMTLKAFVHGGALYRDIYSPYGPFYYELFGGLFSATGTAVTTDAGRSVVMVVWVLASLMFGIAAHRLTGRLLLGVTGMIAAFAVLNSLSHEPMHPQGLCVLLLGAFALIAVGEPGRRAAWQGGAAGALLAALTLTKVNLGVFAVAAVVVAAAWTLNWARERRWLSGPIVLLFLAMPAVVLARDLDEGWVRELLVIEVLSALAILLVAKPDASAAGSDDPALLRWLWGGAAGFAAGVVAILAVILLTGPNLADVYDGMVTQALRIRDLLVQPIPFPPAAVNWSIVAVAAAALIHRLRARGAAVGPLWSAILRAVAGLAILFTIAGIGLVGLTPSPGNPDVVAMVLAWVAAVPLAGGGESSHRRFLRVLLPALAVAETLQVYPVAGSQLGIAAIAFVPVGALCLADAAVEARRWAALGGAAQLERTIAVTGVALATVAGIFALDTIVLAGATNADNYRLEESLDLPGAGQLHLPAAEAETYRGVVALLHRYHCTTFVGYPSINSFYLWSGLEAPRVQLPNGWMKALDRSQQQQAVEELRASPRPCAIRNIERAEAYVQGEDLRRLPLVGYVFEDFRLAAKVGPFEFFLPKPEATK